MMSRITWKFISKFQIPFSPLKFSSSPLSLSLSHTHRDFFNPIYKPTHQTTTKKNINRTKMVEEQPETLDSETLSSEEVGLEELETDVKQMAQKIVELRETLPGQLHDTMASILDAQRPVILTRFDTGLDPGPSGEPVSDATSLKSSKTLLVEKNQENAEKIAVIKQKISSNTASIPLLLKRLRDSISRIDKLNSSNETIPPVFKRKRTN